MSNLKLDKTETSVFTLLSHYILMNQTVESLFGKENILFSDFDADDSPFQDMVNDTIHEALVYQILLKACAYMDEWNYIFGVDTEANDKEKIRYIKTITKPAHKAVASWRGLKDFRNQAIAHNHRDKKGANIYLEPREFHSPETSGEIVFLVFCLEKMTDVVNHFFPEVAKKVLSTRSQRTNSKKRKFMTKGEIKTQMENIENSIADSLMRNSVFSTMVDAIAKGGGSHTRE